MKRPEKALTDSPSSIYALIEIHQFSQNTCRGAKWNISIIRVAWGALYHGTMVPHGAHYHANDGLHPPLSRDVHCKAGERCISLFYVIMSCYIGPSAKLWNEWAGLLLYLSSNNVFHHDMSILAPLNISKLRSPWSLWTFMALQILQDDYQKRLDIETSNPI